MRDLWIFVLGMSIYLAAQPAFAACGAVVDTNPVTATEEKVWAEHDGHDFEIQWAEKIGGVWSNQTTLTANAQDDLCPALAFDSDGSTAVAWRRSGSYGQIFYRGRKDVAGVFVWQSAEVAVSNGLSDASAPAVRFDGAGQVYVAWHEAASPALDVFVSIGAGIEPWPTAFDTPSFLGSASLGLNPLVSLNFESGATWITWVSQTDELLYSERDTSSGWLSPGAVEIFNGDHLTARQVARDAVLN